MNIPISSYLDLLAEYLRPQRLRVAALGLLLMGSIAVQLVNPQLIRQFIDTATSGGATDELFRLAAVFVGVAVAGQALAVAATWLSEVVGWTATNALRTRLFEHCLRLDMSFHKARTPGEMIQRIDGDVDALSNFFSQLVVQVLGNLVLIAGVLVLLLVEDWRVGLPLGAFAVFALYVLTRLRGLGVPHWARDREASAQFYGFLGEQLAGTEDIRANGGRDWVMNRFYTQNQAWLRHRVRASATQSVMWSSSMATFAIANSIAFAVGAWLFRDGEVSIGTVYIMFYYTELLRRPIEQIRTQMQELQAATASIGRVRELLAVEAKIVDGPGAALPEGALSLDFENVSFRYEDDEPVLNGVGFAVEPGRVLGLLGRTGSGKTTLARLLFRLYDVDGGAIRLSGIDVRHPTLDQLRQRVGMVTQDVQVFNASVRDNLALFDSTVSDARLLAVIDDIGLGPWFERLPAGLATEIAPDGLSAGEAQLLAFARLFLADPGLVILDEASSRLDPATERLIETAVSRLIEGRTAILIAHRLATLERVHDVLILDAGHVAEYGPRASLAADPASIYAGLLRTDAEGVLA